MTRVLFVCLGNICRSPLAEGIMKHKTDRLQQGNNFFIDSCGTGAYHIGEQPDPRTVSNARLNGVSLNHQARQFEESDFDEFDYILIMDRSNLYHIQKLDIYGSYSKKIFLIRDFDPSDQGADVPDPYFGGERGFQDVFEILEISIGNFLEHLNN